MFRVFFILLLCFPATYAAERVSKVSDRDKLQFLDKVASMDSGQAQDDDQSSQKLGNQQANSQAEDTPKHRSRSRLDKNAMKSKLNEDQMLQNPKNKLGNPNS